MVENEIVISHYLPSNIQFSLLISTFRCHKQWSNIQIIVYDEQMLASSSISKSMHSLFKWAVVMSRILRAQTPRFICRTLRVQPLEHRKKLGIQEIFVWLTVTSCRVATVQLEPTATNLNRIFPANSSWLHVLILKHKVVFCSWNTLIWYFTVWLPTV